MPNKQERISLAIPAYLYKKLQGIQAEDNKNSLSVSDAITYLLTKVLDTTTPEEGAGQQPFSDRDLEQLKEKLRALGHWS